MKANQKYFPLLDAAGKLTDKFLVVSNIRPDDPSAVIQGNERVVRPRLADAKFFFDQDRKKTLESRVAGLDKVVYHAKLGSMRERVERVRQIARWVAERIGADVENSDRAALLAKADLLTDMVGEFPELQGVMGGYYARHDGEPGPVADAIAAQYVNRRSEQEEAQSLVGEALLIADRTETLVGIWGIGLKPTGEKDPYALRRHALTIISSIEMSASPLSPRAHKELSFQELLNCAFDTFKPRQLLPTTVEEVETFVFERYFNQLVTVFGANEVDAVISQRPPLQEVTKRVRAVRDFMRLPESASLAAANKRISNILKKSDAKPASSVDDARLIEPAEKALRGSIAKVAPRADALFEQRDYTASLRELAALKAPVDAFFDQVMVNADDPVLRANRLALLAHLHRSMNRVADLSRLAT
jgi:glycyl-tRNA synthetase beta chain